MMVLVGFGSIGHFSTHSDGRLQHTSTRGVANSARSEGCKPSNAIIDGPLMRRPGTRWAAMHPVDGDSGVSLGMELN